MYFIKHFSIDDLSDKCFAAIAKGNIFIVLLDKCDSLV